MRGWVVGYQSPFVYFVLHVVRIAVSEQHQLAEKVSGVLAFDFLPRPARTRAGQGVDASQLKAHRLEG